MTQKEMEEIDYALMVFLDKKSRLIVIEKMDEIGFTKRPQDNNALVPLDFQVIFDMLFDRTQYSVDSCKDIAEEICAKFGKDNSGMDDTGEPKEPVHDCGCAKEKSNDRRTKRRRYYIRTKIRKKIL